MKEPKFSVEKNARGLVHSEWTIVISLMLLMASFAMIAKINAFRSASILKENFLSHHELCEIEISGEVAKPGTFIVIPGTPLKKILKKSSPTPFANLRRIDLNKSVETSAHYKVERLTEILVRIEGLPSGAIDVVIPAGTRMCHLKSYVNFEDAGLYLTFSNRRILRDGDVVSIEKKSDQKQVEVKSSIR